MEEFTFSHKNIFASKHYTLYREERTQLRGIITENKITAEISLKLSKNVFGEDIFTVGISDYKQSNKEGLYQWVQDLLPIRKEVVFSVAENGLIGNIRNHRDIKNIFSTLIPYIIKKHSSEKNNINIGKGISLLVDDPERLAATWRYTAPYINLFAGTHGRNYRLGTEISGYRELPNFIGIKQIPIYTSEKLVKTATRKEPFYEIEIAGFLAKDRIDQGKLSALVRLLRNHPRAITDMTLRYNENHKLDSNHWTYQTICMSLVVIPGFLNRKETTILRET